MTEPHSALDRAALRKALRARRRSVSPAERARAGQLVALNADRYLHLRPGLRIAIYAAMPTELDTAPLIELARNRNCTLYVPRIDRHSLGRKMRFVELTGPRYSRA
jgi:5-formyltetrahydrofolate cyclo-ligase